jgi:hypothetical protein
MLTYVTAFYPIRTDVPVEAYMNEFRKLMETGVPILLFTEPDTFIRDLEPNVRQVSLPLVRYENVILPKQRNAQKDTVEFMSLMLMKMKCMTEALQYTDSSHLAWIDFRVFYIVQHTPIVQEKLRALTTRSFQGLTKIAAPGCWNPTPAFDILNSICWRFCGGFFLGPRDIFPLAYQQQTQLVQEHLPHLTWEVNYWTKMEEYFLWYAADHKDSIIMNMPYSPQIVRPNATGHYVDGGKHRRVHVGGGVEQALFRAFCDVYEEGLLVIPKTDMLVETNEYRRMKSSVPWDDPAIAEEGSFPKGTVVCLDTSRMISQKGVLHYPLDDDMMLSGIHMEVPSWESRQPVAIWRGGSSGVERPTARMRVVNALLASPHADAKFVRGGWPQNDADIPVEHFGNRISFEDHATYKYMFVIDGNGVASSAQWVFVTGCVPLFVTHPSSHYWLKDILTPWVHYVPISYDLSDIHITLQWLVDHDEEARAIAKNALTFARTCLTPTFQNDYIHDRMKKC